MAHLSEAIDINAHCEILLPWSPRILMDATRVEISTIAPMGGGKNSGRMTTSVPCLVRLQFFAPTLLLH